VLQVDMTLKLQVKIKRPQFTLDGDEARLFESKLQWLTTRSPKKVTITYWCKLGFEKFHRVASSRTKVGTCKESIGIDVNTTAKHNYYNVQEQGSHYSTTWTISCSFTLSLTTCFYLIISRPIRSIKHIVHMYC